LQAEQANFANDAPPTAVQECLSRTGIDAQNWFALFRHALYAADPFAAWPGHNKKRGLTICSSSRVFVC
jgi:hypothetical protein